MTERHPDVYVVGTGMVSFRQLTMEVMSALEVAETIYLVHHHPAQEEYLRKKYDADVVDLTDEYANHDERRETYDAMAETVLAGAESAEDPVALALYGHPMVFVYPSRLVAERGPDRGLAVETLPGISSMDCLYADINFDPAEHGLQMFEATDMLVRDWTVNPEIPAMVWQIGIVESSFAPAEKSAPERFTRIREHLQRFYPDDHTAYLLETAITPKSESTRTEFTLDEFEAMHDEITPSQTLFLPPTRERPPQNPELLEEMRSESHYERITTDETFDGTFIQED